VTPLYVYTPARDADLLVAQLWARMAADGDLDRVFSNPDYPLSAFLTLLAPPHETIYAMDDDGIFMIVWFERFAAGTFLSAYFRPDKRKCRDTDELFRRVLKSGVDAYSTIINLTWQAYLTPIHLAMGYELNGRIPGLFNGRDALIFSCNSASFARAEARGQANDAAERNGQERRWRDMIQQENGGMTDG